MHATSRPNFLKVTGRGMTLRPMPPPGTKAQSSFSPTSAGEFQRRCRVTVEPQFTDERQSWERPEILVEFAGPDSTLVLERGAELLRSFEMLSQEMLRLGPEEHELVSFDCRNFRATRLRELKTSAEVAAERVRKSGMPYEFGPMSSRERRILHL